VPPPAAAPPLSNIPRIKDIRKCHQQCTNCRY
jgi:hypothetical protein